MKLKSTRYHKPDFLVLFTFFVGFGLLATSLVQAADPLNIMTNGKARTEQPASGDWLHSLWGLDLAGKLQQWKPKISVDEGGEGIRLMRPFGVRGPALRVLSGVPDSGESSLRSSSGSYLDTYLFLEKRW
ncbi:MAG: hypothetical protein BMS9Abin06_1136 [Gammaproteobacteria bacterium]|nr:MAG: hypothetical protein BMS9Abin06_1136 [Gammaproteobacteria bacterium]